ncbi:mitochondrial fumarylacetoacetate hydrolase (acylpyruvate hydrolase) [Andalucia godoyi]|uniref:Mitochondrial fumarylacetoacetate hydrolase (Acylpyruvate hydrolase) n=1 Tax=Andalucia godoyi TaxID=505711 RepID=A0A8K0AJZ7_ANDGO|nr:mitochondrial fumarylacetoacetate hydrolase (acylpyruvate hydrolase) [Andalucia godoyi]|eukprot:ANDGO_06334.mRNA.1 mitochondrial fumarylacetoacetate hydrolase (acylpyruvate hydrolase)
MSSRVVNFVREGKKILGVLRNYRAHATELGNPVPKEPIFFLKPTTAYLSESSDAKIVIPKGAEVHHEVELAVVIGKNGRNIAVSDALSHVGGYALALDMTARNYQQQAKEAGLPWFKGKCWDTFAPISELISKDAVEPSLQSGKLNLVLTVDGVQKQNATTSSMIFDVATIIAAASRVVTLEEGDVILTGTPEGVGPVSHGNIITARMIDQSGKTISQIKFPVVAEQ